MDLILSVLADPQGANMLKHTKLFTPAGGSLGRADGNDWVLPDPERVVSSRHALIAFSDNQYFLEDNSTNGTYHNRGDNPLGKGNRVALNDGDIIGVGDYQLKVTLRRPKVDADLPKGLGDADFLDNADRTTFSPAAAAKMQHQAEAQQLDSWLEPGAGANSTHSGEWGYVGSGSQPTDGMVAPAAEEVDPLAAFGSGSAVEQDPLAGFGGGSGAAGGSQWADDDWWKEDGSAQDNAPADRHAMHFTAQQPQPPAEEVPAQFTAPAPTPPAPTPPAPTPVPAPVPPAADNPFAESLAAMQGQQVEGAPGFDSGPLGADPAAGFPSASQPFSQLQQAPPPAPVQPNPAPPVQPNPAPPVQANPAPPVQPAVPPNTPQAPAHTAAAPAAGALAAALGLNLAPAQQQQLDQQAAAIVRETIARLIDLLRARTSIKNELRVQRTMIQTEANNPLKFSASAADALAAMFAGNGAFMDPQRAVADSFDDLSDHQVAVLAGMRAGYDAMLKFFNPDNIERRLNTPGGMFGSKNARNWEGFVEMYRELVRDPDACYRRLFGEEFASTYENQLSELKNARHLQN